MACNPPYKRGSGSWCDCNCYCIHPDCYEEIILYYSCVPYTPTPTPTYGCDTVTSSGGEGVTTKDHSVPPNEGEITFTYDAFSIPDAFKVEANGVVYVDTGSVSGSGSKTFCKPQGVTTIKVTVTGPTGTAWTYTLGCPTKPCNTPTPTPTPTATPTATPTPTSTDCFGVCCYEANLLKCYDCVDSEGNSTPFTGGTCQGTLVEGDCPSNCPPIGINFGACVVDSKSNCEESGIGEFKGCGTSTSEYCNYNDCVGMTICYGGAGAINEISLPNWVKVEINTPGLIKVTPTPTPTPTPEITHLTNLFIAPLAQPAPTPSNCELRMTLMTDGCCIEYDSGTLYTVGDGYLDLSISSDSGDLKYCCDKFNINGSEFSGSNNISIFLPDGEEITIEPDAKCYCRKLDNQTAKNNFLSQCNSEPLSLLNKKPYKIFKNLESGKYEIYFS